MKKRKLLSAVLSAAMLLTSVSSTMAFAEDPVDPPSSEPCEHSYESATVEYEWRSGEKDTDGMVIAGNVSCVAYVVCDECGAKFDLANADVTIEAEEEATCEGKGTTVFEADFSNKTVENTDMNEFESAVQELKADNQSYDTTKATGHKVPSGFEADDKNTAWVVADDKERATCTVTYTCVTCSKTATAKWEGKKDDSSEDATCTKAGSSVFKATFTEKITVDDKVEAIAELGHDVSEQAITYTETKDTDNVPTGVSKAKATCKRTGCDQDVEVDVTSTEKENSATAATCIAKASKTFTVTFNDNAKAEGFPESGEAKIEYGEVDATKHNFKTYENAEATDVDAIRDALGITGNINASDYEKSTCEDCKTAFDYKAKTAAHEHTFATTVTADDCAIAEEGDEGEKKLVCTATLTCTDKDCDNSEGKTKTVKTENVVEDTADGKSGEATCKAKAFKTYNVTFAAGTIGTEAVSFAKVVEYGELADHTVPETGEGSWADTTEADGAENAGKLVGTCSVCNQKVYKDKPAPALTVPSFKVPEGAANIASEIKGVTTDWEGKPSEDTSWTLQVNKTHSKGLDIFAAITGVKIDLSVVKAPEDYTGATFKCQIVKQSDNKKLDWDTKEINGVTIKDGKFSIEGSGYTKVAASGEGAVTWGQVVIQVNCDDVVELQVDKVTLLDGDKEICVYDEEGAMTCKHGLFDAKTATGLKDIEFAFVDDEENEGNKLFVGTATGACPVCEAGVDVKETLETTATTKAPKCVEVGTITTAIKDGAEFENDELKTAFGALATDEKTNVKEIPALGHLLPAAPAEGEAFNWTIEATAPATDDATTTTVTTAAGKCQNCEVVLPAGIGVVTAKTTEATCEKGKTTVYTATFKDSEGNAIANLTAETTKVWGAPLAADYTDQEAAYTWAEDNSTCTATLVCKNCEGKVEGHKIVEEGTVTSASNSTCQTKGKTTFTATFTNEKFAKQTVEVEDEEFGDHKYTIDPDDVTKKTVVWTKGEDGTYTCTFTAKCVNCDEDAEESIAATVTSENTATCVAAGKITYTAKFSKGDINATEDKTFTKEENSAALGHDYADVEGTAQAATCTEDGKKADQKCSRCDDVQTGAKIDKLGHDADITKVSYKWSDDNKKCTATAPCKRCDENAINETVDATTATKDGKTIATATFKTAGLTAQTKDVTPASTPESDASNSNASDSNASDSNASGTTSDTTTSGATSDTTTSGATSDTTTSGATSDTTSAPATSDTTSAPATSDTSTPDDTSKPADTSGTQLTAPKNFGLKKNGTTSITLSWKKVTGATGYTIQQKNGKKWTTVATVKKGATVTATIKKLKAATTYTFQIRADGKKASKFTSLTVTTQPTKVANLKASKKAKTSVTLKWKKNTTAKGYQVQVKNGKKWKTVKTITKNKTVKATIKKLKKNTNYQFRVRAYTTSGKTKIYGAAATVKAKTKK